MRQRGSILIGVLWCMALLSVIVVGVLHTARLDLLVVKNYGDRLQAHYLALAGVERAKALLYHDYITRRQGGLNHNGSLYNDSGNFENVSFARGRFRVFRAGTAEEGGGTVYGISDEESRLNINTAFEGELTNLSGMTPDVAESIVAWRSDVGQGVQGAGEDYYAALQPPYVPRHAPFQSVGELLMVKGVLPTDVFGASGNRPADENAPPTEEGWSSMLTATSSEQNTDASGTARVNIQNADEKDLQAISGITSDIAKAIIAYRGKNKFESIADLLKVPPAPANKSKNGGASSQSDNSGSTVINEQLFSQIADKVTISTDSTTAGMININTAGVEVLAALPGMDRVIAQAIVLQRKSNGFFKNTAEVLPVQGMTRDIYKQIAPLIVARSETFRVNCEGPVNSSGARQRVQAIFHIASHEIVTLFYREVL